MNETAIHLFSSWPNRYFVILELSIIPFCTECPDDSVFLLPGPHKLVLLVKRQRSVHAEVKLRLSYHICRVVLELSDSN